MFESLIAPKSSIAKKQIVAGTGLLLIGFVISHLAGNLFIYGGPEIFNNYAKKLASLRPGLYVIEVGLLLIFLLHIYITALLVLENIKARPVNYKVYTSKNKRSLSARLMPISGFIVLAFVVWHLLDFTFIDHNGPRSVLNDGVSYGLYGVVYNSFSDPMHSMLYIIAMASIGFHLSHGLQSFFQTMGMNNEEKALRIKNFSNSFGLIIALGYSSIPVYVLIKNVI